jgi:hypothetical protein
VFRLCLIYAIIIFLQLQREDADKRKIQEDKRCDKDFLPIKRNDQHTPIQIFYNIKDKDKDKDKANDKGEDNDNDMPTQTGAMTSSEKLLYMCKRDPFVPLGKTFFRFLFVVLCYLFSLSRHVRVVCVCVYRLFLGGISSWPQDKTRIRQDKTKQASFVVIALCLSCLVYFVSYLCLVVECL